MKPAPLFQTALAASLLLLGACNEQKPIQETNAPVSAATQATLDSAATGAGHAAMDHAAMGHGAPAGAEASPQVAAMNEMMQQMHATQPTGNTDHDFAQHMLAHHQGAVVMADLQLRDGKDATMRQMAAKIKADQQREITELQAFVGRLAKAPANYEPSKPADPFTRKMQKSMEAMMPMPEPGPNPDVSFNRLMTVHHQSAVDMAQAELAHGQDAKLKALAQQMITAQQKEIQQLRDWHAQHAAQAKPVAYNCPMKCAGSASTKPGSCPTCGMALVKK